VRRLVDGGLAVPSAPTSIAPAGSPSTRPQGRLIAGWWVQSKGEVLGSISKARARISPIGAFSSGKGVATIGRVGIRRRSWSASTAS
jgi:hypothetical protein